MEAVMVDMKEAMKESQRVSHLEQQREGQIVSSLECWMVREMDLRIVQQKGTSMAAAKGEQKELK